MADILDENGLSVDNYNTLLSNLQNEMQAIYAPDGDTINFDSETPDGQLTNIFAQAGTDMRELLQEIYNSFDPEKCSGRLQDIRYALNGITRNSGTYTIQNIDVTVDRTVTLEGLDDKYNDETATSYTVGDNAGNLWYLIDTVELEKGTHSLPFRSKNMGLVQPTIGTITNMVTIILGVTSVNNSVAPTTLGDEQESDVAFRIRRGRSTEVRGQSNTDAMLAQLLNLDGVTDCDVWVNSGSNPDETGTPAGYVWVIVEGGANSDIADIIYANSCGRGTRGEVDVDKTAISGQIFKLHFDRPTPIPLYIKFDFKLTVSQDATDTTAIVEDFVENLKYTLYQDAETSIPTTTAYNAVVANGGGGYPLNLQISLNGSDWTDYIKCPARNNKFVVDSSHVTVNILEEGS